MDEFPICTLTTGQGYSLPFQCEHVHPWDDVGSTYLAKDP